MNRAAQARTIQPERIILTFSGDPTSSMAVSWRTQMELGSACAQIKPATDLATSDQNPLVVRATSQPLILDSGVVFHHSVVFQGLIPGSTYIYRVGNATAWSDWYRFRAALRQAKPFRFLYFGDEQNDLRNACAGIIRLALEKAPDARFMLHTGDLTDTPSNDAEWGDWFAMAGRFNAMIPSLPAVGNHQYEKKWYSPWSLLTRHWQAHFALPENGVAGLEETCYFIDYQGLRIVVLNSKRKLAEQAQWLDRILANNPNRWTVALFHHPIFSGIKRRDNTELRGLWKPILEKHAVDLVLQGHDHVYGRSNPAANPSRLEPVYVVSVAGPKFYPAGDPSWAARIVQDTQMYQVISVNEEGLRFEAYTAANEKYDAFEILWRGGQKTFASEPLGQEHLRPEGRR